MMRKAAELVFPRHLGHKTSSSNTFPAGTALSGMSSVQSGSPVELQHRESQLIETADSR